MAQGLFLGLEAGVGRNPHLFFYPFTYLSSFERILLEGIYFVHFVMEFKVNDLLALGVRTDGFGISHQRATADLCPPSFSDNTRFSATDTGCGV